VQCAIAQRIHKSACAWEEVDEGLKSAGLSAMNGQTQPEGHPGGSVDAKSISFSSVIDQSNSIGGGSCPSDTVIPVAGHSFTIPFSKLCGSLQLLGNLVVAFAMLAAAFIVFRN